jgi:hypothetical protein
MLTAAVITSSRIPERKYTVKPGVDLISAKEVTIDLACSGVSPLLMDMWRNLPSASMCDVLGSKPQREQKLLEEIAEEKIYRDTEGFPAYPYEGFFAALREAGRDIVVTRGRKGRNAAKITATHWVLKTNLSSIQRKIVVDGHENPEMIRLVLPEGTDPTSKLPSDGGEKGNDPKSPWRVDMRQSGTSRIVRARFDAWGFRLRIVVDLAAMEGLTIEHIYKLVERAGRNTGFGAFRPSTGGPFGRFRIDTFEVIAASR